MDVQEYTLSNYKNLVLRGLEFSTLAYSEPNDICKVISADPNLDLVWGPVQLSDWGFFAYSAMFAVRHIPTNDIWVAIRGTQYDSLWSWFYEDFAVGKKANLYHLSQLKNKKADIWISEGSFLGMCYLTNMRDGLGGPTLADTLKTQTYNKLFVTGHSLGGTLTPPFFVYLNELLNGGAAITNMGLFTFAGLTPGGTAFNKVFNGLFPHGNPVDWRIHNSLDVAPYMWESQTGVKDVYSAHGLNYWYYGEPGERIRTYFRRADALNIGYAQPQSGRRLTGVFDTRYVDREFWSIQAAHQHGTATYKSLIQAQL